MKTAPAKISIIMPVLNEAKVLASTIAYLIHADNIEIIIVDGGSQDDTVAIAQSLGVKVSKCDRSRARQMNLGAKIATGDILLFLHADTRLPPSFAPNIRHALAATNHGTIIAGAFSLQIDAQVLSLRLIEWGVNWRSRILQMPYGDQAIFLNAQVFQAIGGFPDLPIMEDFEFVRRLRRWGQIAIIPVPVITSARRWLRLGVWQTTLINQGAIIAYLLGVSPQQIARWYHR